MSEQQEPDPFLWERVTDSGPFIQFIGPFYRLTQGCGPDEPVRYGFRVNDHHCNPYRTCHGGMLCSFVDFCMFRAFLAQFPELTGSPTLNMALDYFSGAKLGEWVESRVTITARTKGTIFTSCDLVAGDRKLLRATGIFPAWRKDGVRN